MIAAARRFLACASVPFLVLSTVPLPASAHPHVFIDAGADFEFDDDGRLSAIRVTWILDHFVTLFLLEALGADADRDGALTPEEEARIVADQMNWDEGYEGDSYLDVGGAPTALAGPSSGEAALQDGKLTLRFTRPLEEPVNVPGGDAGAIARIYDPVFFYAYFVTEKPQLMNAPDGCSAEVHPFEPTTELAALQQTLFELDQEEEPEQPEVGRLFADRIVLSCG
ncbi:MAG: DUF1007 family protein [Pseudomonadota bacterium]